MNYQGNLKRRYKLIENKQPHIIIQNIVSIDC